MLAAAGKTRFVWFTDRDLGPGITEHVTVGVTPVPYMIIDVGDGPDATGYPVSIQYLLDIPASTGWTDAYKTTKIPMRWIRPDLFNREGYTANFPQVAVNYWIAVFETTQRQYEMVTGLKRGTYEGPMRPVDNLTWDEISNYIACLKSKTGRKFNLPSKTRWEYACRAGSALNCYDGTSSCVRKAAFAGSGSSVDLGRYAGNCDDGRGGFAEHTNVGSYVPNAFGLYDMLGNVGEFALFSGCIDRVPPKKNYENTSYTQYDSYFQYLGSGKGDYRKGSYYNYNYSPAQSFTCYYYEPSNYSSEYVYRDTKHYLVFQGGGYLSDVADVGATNVSYSASAVLYPTPKTFSYDNLNSQPEGFKLKINSLQSGAQNGFRLYCDAE